MPEQQTVDMREIEQLVGKKEIMIYFMQKEIDRLNKELELCTEKSPE